MEKILAIMVILLFSSSAANAGYKTYNEVIVQEYSSGGGRISGNLYDTRNSSDNTQRMACTYNNQSGSFFCFGIDATGFTKSCTTTDTSFMNAISSMSEFSVVSILFDQNGVCTDFSVIKSSYYSPE